MLPMKITLRVSLAMILVVTIIIAGFAIILTMETDQSLERELNDRAAIITSISEKSLPVPMWNMDTHQLDDFMEALLTDAALVYAEYTINGDTALTTKHDVETHTGFEHRPWTFFAQSPHFLTRSITIAYQQEPLGFIRFAVSKAQIQADFQHRMLVIGLETLILIGAISLTSIVITTRWIIRPLQTLQISANRLAQGHLEEPIDTSRRDELGYLAHSFAAMRDAIRNTIGDLNRANEELSQEVEERTAIEHELRRHKEHLEDLVQERTAELRTMNTQLLQEIAERQQIEQALQQAKEAAEAANQAKSTFLANMSHELRTPLNSILGFAQIMTHNPNLPPEEQDYLATIQRSGDHLLALINQVLDLSKIEAGRLTLHEQEIDLLGLLDEVHDLFALNAEEKRLRFVSTRTDDLPRMIRTDDVKLRQVLINLIGNAIKFTSAGSVILRVHSERLNVQEGAKALTTSLIFEIEDTGPGIAPEEMNALFEAFGQTATGRQAQQGSGLGLAISRRFVQLMGGEISVRSKVGQGTTFTFTILCQIGSALPQQAPIINRVVALEPDQPRYRLLIVDDQHDNRRLLSTLFKSFEFDLREAGNGEEAIAIWQTWQPHLIWMDLRMPVMGGYEATQQIRRLEEQKERRAAEQQTENGMQKTESRGQEERLQKLEVEGQSAICNLQSAIRTVIIALSASSVEDESAAALANGCDDFLRKPFREHEIFDLLQKHLQLRFVYAADQRTTSNKQHAAISKALTPEDVAALPDAVRQELREAVEALDVEKTLRVIDRIRPQHAALAEAMTELVQQYRFDVLQQLLADCVRAGNA